MAQNSTNRPVCSVSSVNIDVEQMIAQLQSIKAIDWDRVRALVKEGTKQTAPVGFAAQRENAEGFATVFVAYHRDGSPVRSYDRDGVEQPDGRVKLNIKPQTARTETEEPWAGLETPAPALTPEQALIAQAQALIARLRTGQV